MCKVKQISRKKLNSTQDEFITRDRSITVDEDNKTGDITIEVTLFGTVAERCFDRLAEDDRRKWVEGFFNGANAPRIREFTLIKKGH